MLTETMIQRLTAGKKKVFDKGGLYLFQSESGFRSWRFDYRRPNGRRATMTIGKHPAVSLSQARSLHAQARAELERGTDPGGSRKAKKTQMETQIPRLDIVTRAWLFDHAATWSNGHSDNVQQWTNELLMHMGATRCNDVQPGDILAVLRSIAARSSSSAHRARAVFSQLFRYAAACGHCSTDPTAMLRGALPPTKKKHFPATTTPDDMRTVVRRMLSIPAGKIKDALFLQVLTLCRPGEIAQMHWSDVNMDAAIWTIPGPQMKSGRDHVVPLSPQAMEILRRRLPAVGYVFCNQRAPERPMATASMRAALRSCGVSRSVQSVHGWRATGRTILEEVLGFPAHIIEMQLAHAVRDPLGRAYNRTTWIAERTAMLCEWGKFVDADV